MNTVLKEKVDINAEILKSISDLDLADLCNITEQAINAGGGFGWLTVPPRDILKKYWNGIMLINNKKLNNLVFFNYSPELDKFLYWSQQLIAESLGKKGKGFLPIISPAPKDHHSLLQLYLDGPEDKLFYVFGTDAGNKEKLNSNFLDKKLDFLNNKSLSQIKAAQKNAFLKSLKKKRIPFREFKIRDFSEKVLGELFSYFILETAIVGKLININPFDQPAVEEVKINTKRILS